MKDRLTGPKAANEQLLKEIEARKGMKPEALIHYIKENNMWLGGEGPIDWAVRKVNLGQLRIEGSGKTARLVSVQN
jgi:hypothetical protein